MSLHHTRLSRRSYFRLQTRSLSSERAHIVGALNSALQVADPKEILKHKIRVRDAKLIVETLELDLSRFKRILLLGGGKASAGMAVEVEKILGKRLAAGVVNVPDYVRQRPRSPRIRFCPSTHPIPSMEGTKGVKMMLDMVGRPSTGDLIICVISGGGSALMPLPMRGIRLADLQALTRVLLKSGAEIDEMNVVRKHLSALAGGRLAEKLYPATVLTLLISDVVGDRLDAIASGPTAPDSSTYLDAMNVLKKYDAWNAVSERIRIAIREGIGGRLSETPKSDSRIFENVHNVILASNKDSCVAAAASLRKAGYKTLVLSTRTRGEAKEVGKFLASILCEIKDGGLLLSPPAAIVAGGETTVTVVGNGKGGRNQELVLSASLGIDGLSNTVVASIGTDGVDGPTNAAGAIADGRTIRRAKSMGLDAHTHLKRNDAYPFFRKLDDLLVTGPTGTNVNDIAIAVAGQS